MSGDAARREHVRLALAGVDVLELFQDQSRQAIIWLLSHHVLFEGRFYRVSIGLAKGQDKQLSRWPVFNSLEDLIANLIIEEFASFPAEKDQVEICFLAERVHLHAMQE